MTYQANDKVDNSCTATSMYLSFEDESSPLYKTLAAIDDKSAISIDLNADKYSENYNDYNQESTLEADNVASPMLNGLERVIDNDLLKNDGTGTVMALKPLQKFNALISSTPSKEQLHKNFDLPSDVEDKMHIMCEKNIEDVDPKPSDFRVTSAPLLSHLIGENKENISPEGKQAANVSSSSSSSITITPLKEQQIQPDDYVDKISPKVLTTISPQELDRKLTNNILQTNASSYKHAEVHTINSVAKCINKSHKSQDNLIKIDESKSTEISKTSEAEIEIPHLINKVLQISTTVSTKITKQINSCSIVATTETGAATMVGDKRPYNQTRRKSTVVRTTLNSSAYKMSRKSMANAGCTISQSRRSMIPQNIQNTKFIKTKVPQKTPIFSKTLASETLTTEQSDKNKNNKPELMTNISKSRKSVYAAHTNKSETNYICLVCKAKFLIKSLFDAHKLCHEFDGPEQPKPTKKKMDNIKSNSSLNPPNTMLSSITPITLSCGYQCKYCDKKFALQRTLHIHLLENCQKIPPADKRKLQFTENKHVMKAQLPNVFNTQINGNALAKKTLSVKPISDSRDTSKANHQTKSGGELSRSSSSLMENKSSCKTLEVASSCGTPAKTAGKVRKTQTAHQGVYCTPNKAIPCHLCKLSFKTILDFTNHNLMCHMRSYQD